MYTLNRSALEPKYHSKCSTGFLFYPQRPVQYSYAINSTVQCNALRQAIPSINQALHQVGHVSNWRLIHSILHHAPYS